jgi:hypothetical protein
LKSFREDAPGPGMYESHVISGFQRHKSPTFVFGNESRDTFKLNGGGGGGAGKGVGEGGGPGPGNYA